MIFSRYVKLLLFTVLAVGLAVCSALAQPNWPNKPVKLLVPYAPGGTADLLGRLVAQQLDAVYTQSFYIENRPGAGGTVGSLAVAKTAPNGYTLLISGIGSHVIGPALTAADFDPLQDFSHIVVLGGPPTVLVVHPDLPIKDLKGFLLYARAHQGGLSWGSPGQGTHGQLIGELFTASANLQHMAHAPYRGGAPAVADLIGGHIQAAFVTYSSANAHIQSGKVRALAVTSSRRMRDLREVPTFSELGYPQLTATTWFAVSGPRGLPLPLVQQLNSQIRHGLRQPEALRVLAREGIETVDFDAAQSVQFLEAETLKWTRLIRDWKLGAAP
jgi:tripartite-type tricarboxylate transporter receptor subunit TctC